MRDLGDIYESARVSIPLRTFPERNTLPEWHELDERVLSELALVQKRILSVLRGDDRLLANHHRVIGDFNRGVRQGFLANSGQATPPGSGLSRSPFEWGQLVGFQAKGRERNDAPLIKQFMTVTHLLAYEFRQLNLAFNKPFDFLMRNIGPDRADEFGELVLAVPILLNYRRELVARIIDEPDFSFSAHHVKQPPGPSHLEYLSQGIVALFDPEPTSWTRVAANLGLATLPFNDGTTLQSADFQAPHQLVAVTASKPIAARIIVRRQMDRIELARRWIGSDPAAIDFEERERAPTTLWDVYQSTQAAAIRGQDWYFADVVANNVVSLLSERIEATLAPQDTRIGYLRRHLPAFTRGFDARSDRVVDVRAIVSAQFGRRLSDGLRRFENGGLYVAGVSRALAELGISVNDLHHALENVTAFVRKELAANEQTDLAGQLTKLFDANPTLLSELFAEHSQFEFFSRTQIQTHSPFDLMRSALFHIVQATQPSNEQRDSQKTLLGKAQTTLRRVVEMGQAPAPRKPEKEDRASSYHVVAVQNSIKESKPKENALTTAARHFEQDFDILIRVIRQLVHALYMARMLSKTQATFLTDRGTHLEQRGAS